MGKLNQLGTIEEVIELCKLGEPLCPVIDFGHVNARNPGEDFLKQPTITALYLIK